MLGLRRRFAVGSVSALAAAGLVAWSGHGFDRPEEQTAHQVTTVAAVGAPEPGLVRTASGSVQAKAVDPSGVEPVKLSYGKHARQKYLAYLPAQRSSDVAVVVVHGGSWISGKPADVASYNRYFATQGIASFAVGYRLATDAVWPAQRTDLSSAVRAIRGRAAEWGFQPDRIAVVGVSAGGHLALDFADRVGLRGTCAVVTYSAPTSMKLVLKDGPKGTSQKRLASAVRKLAPTAALRSSATVPGSPGAGDAPALLFTSQLDWVNRLHALRYAAAYQGVGPDVEADVLAGDTRHASGYAMNDPTILPKSLAFIDRHCG